MMLCFAGAAGAVGEQRTADRGGEVFVERTDRPRAAMQPGCIETQYIERTAHWKGSDRNAACQSFEVDQAERVRAAGEDEDIGGGEGRGELGPVARAEEQDLGVATLQRGARRTVSDDQFGARDGGVEERLNILLDRNPADIKKDRPQQYGKSRIGHHARVKQLKVNA